MFILDELISKARPKASGTVSGCEGSLMPRCTGEQRGNHQVSKVKQPLVMAGTEGGSRHQALWADGPFQITQVPAFSAGGTFSRPAEKAALLSRVSWNQGLTAQSFKSNPKQSGFCDHRSFLRSDCHSQD